MTTGPICKFTEEKISPKHFAGGIITSLHFLLSKQCLDYLHQTYSAKWVKTFQVNWEILI